MNNINLQAIFAYTDFLRKEVQSYQNSTDNLLKILRSMGNDAPEFVVEWLEKSVSEIIDIQQEYMISVGKK